MGLVRALPKIRIRLQKNLWQRRNQNISRNRLLCHFNAGLRHQVVFKKSWKAQALTELAEGPRTTDPQCRTSTFRVELYRESLTELAAVDAFPARLRVWQSTMAGWQVGNYGAAWPADEWQVLPVDPRPLRIGTRWRGRCCSLFKRYCGHGRLLALLSVDRITVKLTQLINSAKMVHAGPQVYAVLMRKWAMILETICPSAW
jgi:hypothetical protein